MSKQQLIKIINKLVSLWESEKLNPVNLPKQEKVIFEKIKILFY